MKITGYRIWTDGLHGMKAKFAEKEEARKCYDMGLQVEQIETAENEAELRANNNTWSFPRPFKPTNC